MEDFWPFLALLPFLLISLRSSTLDSTLCLSASILQLLGGNGRAPDFSKFHIPAPGSASKTHGMVLKSQRFSLYLGPTKSRIPVSELRKYCRAQSLGNTNSSPHYVGRRAKSQVVPLSLPTPGQHSASHKTRSWANELIIWLAPIFSYRDSSVMYA